MVVLISGYNFKGFDVLPRCYGLKNAPDTELISMTPPPSHLSHPKYRPDIDGLRAVAVLAVVTFHAFPTWMKGGFLGVDVFFVISGFLISTIIFENLDRGTFSFSEFYVRRVRRIFPALVVVLLACLGFGWFVLLADELNQLGKHVAASAGFVSNFVSGSEAGYFDNSAETKPLLHLWSLGIEEQFYIVWPLLLWFAWKRKFNLLTLAVVVALVSFYLNVKGMKHDSVATFYSPQARFWELLCGSILAWFVLYKKNSFANIFSKSGGWLAKVIYRQEIKSDGRRLPSVLSLLGCLLLAYGFWNTSNTLSPPGTWALVPVLGAVSIILAGPKAWINRNILSNQIAVWFGLISFPLYLWHWPLLSFARIVENEEPSLTIRITAVVLSVALAWLTVTLIEKPFRFGSQRIGLKVATLCGSVFVIGITGLVVSHVDFSRSHGCEKLAIKRKGFEHAFGSSLAWYRGKNDWLYLGNAYDNTVAKLKLTIVPQDSQVESTKEFFASIAAASSKHNTRLVLIVGPNKSSIYPEYLPDELLPSPKKYSSFFLEKLKEVPNLAVYDPTIDLLALKQSEGFLYSRTDTHWNNKGAFLTYSGFSKLLDLPVPKVEFQNGSARGGDLIGISKLKDFPLHAEDNWVVVWNDKPVRTEKVISNEQKTTFRSAILVANEKPLSDKYVWVVGDSFADPLKQYFNATFKEVRYLGHWAHKPEDWALELANADKKPDMIVVVRVERSF
jgi:peptidoglycan/LPS O-acetylase OafA/YrhL